MRFESLEEAQAYLDRWEQRWADTRIPGTTKLQVAAMFAEEKLTLLPLPLESFRYYQFVNRVFALTLTVSSRASDPLDPVSRWVPDAREKTDASMLADRLTTFGFAIQRGAPLDAGN